VIKELTARGLADVKKEPMKAHKKEKSETGI